MGNRKQLDYYNFGARAWMIHEQIYGEWYNGILAADEALQHAEALLNQTEDISGTGYEGMGNRQSGRLFRLLSEYERLSDFIPAFIDEVRDLDEAFWESVASRAAEDLSHVKLADIKIPNSTELSYYDKGSRMYVTPDNLTIKAFTEHSDLHPEVSGFVDIFQTGIICGDEELTFAELEKIYEKEAQFSNEIRDPGRQVLSEILNICSFGVKQLFDCISGYDIITGEELGTGERVFQGVDASLSFIDVFGFTKMITAPLDAAGKTAVRELGEKAAKEAGEELTEHLEKELAEDVLTGAGENLVRENAESAAELVCAEWAGDAVFDVGGETVENRVIAAARQMDTAVGKLTGEGLENAIENRSMYQIVDQVGETSERKVAEGFANGVGYAAHTSTVTDSTRVIRNTNIIQDVGETELRTAAECAERIVVDEAGDIAQKQLVEESDNIIRAVEHADVGDAGNIDDIVAEHYEELFEQQREICDEYEDYLEALRTYDAPDINQIPDVEEAGLLEQVIGEGGSKSISYKDYDNIYQKSIHNPGKEKVMLGKYDGGGPTSYITKAGDEYTYFSLGSEWDAIKGKYGFTDDDMFKLFNEVFLDDGINGGKTFYFSHNPIEDSDFLGKEYKYLLNNNYIWDDITMTMSPR